ncbi:MAG: 1,4-alpha-glucan branching protein domain-containing protein [Candidatus Eremiobacterota bacterium]
MNVGWLVLLLDAHLPFVRHPGEHPRPLEEYWLFEAITESYVPLLGMFTDLVEEGVPYRLTVSLSPTLLAMLEDEYLQSAYQRHLERLLELSERELARTAHDPVMRPTAEMYHHRFRRVHQLYHERFRGDLVGGFSALRNLGALEVITTAATHAYLPLLVATPEALRAQLVTSEREYRRYFGQEPPGWWLPECAYCPEIEPALGAVHRGYYFLDAPGVLRAHPRPRAAHFAPVATPTGWAVFGRDPECHRQVWHSRDGYPADPVYREFYRDIGWDLPLDYVGPYVQQDGGRMFTGFKYHRITGPTDHKEPYQPWEARRRAWEHAESFLESRLRQAEWLAERLGQPPVLVAPYSAELLGHRWYEGPLWLESVLRQVARQSRLTLETPGRLLDRLAPLQVCRPSASSWGEAGYHQAWVDPALSWVYRHLHGAGRQVTAALRAAPHQERALRQAIRELLVAQASDWIFILQSGVHKDYARSRLCRHLENVARLCDMVSQGEVQEGILAGMEQSTNLFGELDLSAWSVA